MGTIMKLPSLALGLILLAALDADAAERSLRYQEPGREPLFPKNFGYKDEHPPLFDKYYGYRYEKPAPGEEIRIPKQRDDAATGLGRQHGTGTTLGFKREPLGGGSPWDRVGGIRVPGSSER